MDAQINQQGISINGMELNARTQHDLANLPYCSETTEELCIIIESMNPYQHFIKIKN
jgi:hypothetical protein